jgi:dihydropteroate synthase
MPPHNTKLVGIVNVTPDSFSDGGVCFNVPSALKTITQLVSDGADVIDIGAESTRPGATPLTHEEEWIRLEPLLKNLPHLGEVSIDTRHAETARKALEYGVHWINDVSGFASPDMVETVKNSHCKLVIVHSLTVPADKNIVLTESVDVIEELLRFARVRLSALEKAGIAHERIIFDPGIGFGKTAKQSLQVLNQVHRFKELNVPILVGHSRKSFLAKPGDSIEQRDRATLEVSRVLIEQGVDYLRVHNVAQHRQLFTERRAVHG